MAISLLVLVGLALFNFLGSIIQGVAGIGDAICIQVFWLIACELAPDSFLTSALGSEPVRAVALIMYIRLLFMSPLVVYLGLSESIFSQSMTIAMAIPSTILSVIGVLLLAKLDTATIKRFLGLTCFGFAIVYGMIIAYRFWRKQSRVRELKARQVRLVNEAEAIAEEAQQSHNTSLVNLHSSFVHNVPNNSIFALRAPPPPPLSTIASLSEAGSDGRFAMAPSHRGSVIASTTGESVVDARTGLPEDTTEAFLSTITGDIYTAPEAHKPNVNEENVPPLTPSKVSPSRTMTYTRVRINRNLDANGKIKLSTKIGASVAASVAGFMTSLTGVNAPPQIIFILLYDAPNYIVRVNFSAQSIPGNIVRFLMVAVNGPFVFTWAMVPLFLDCIIFGFAGVFVGNQVGRLLGPQSFNIFVLCLLLLCSLAMVNRSVVGLTLCLIITLIVTVVAAYLENKRNKPIIEAQREAELEIEKRLYDCLEELQRCNNSFFPLGHLHNSGLDHLQRPSRAKAAWNSGNFDNDDGDENENVITSVPQPPLSSDERVREASVSVKRPSETDNEDDSWKKGNCHTMPPSTVDRVTSIESPCKAAKEKDERELHKDPEDSWMVVSEQGGGQGMPSKEGGAQRRSLSSEVCVNIEVPAENAAPAEGHTGILHFKEHGALRVETPSLRSLCSSLPDASNSAKSPKMRVET